MMNNREPNVPHGDITTEGGKNLNPAEKTDFLVKTLVFPCSEGTPSL